MHDATGASVLHSCRPRGSPGVLVTPARGAAFYLRNQWRTVPRRSSHRSSTEDYTIDRGHQEPTPDTHWPHPHPHRVVIRRMGDRLPRTRSDDLDGRYPLRIWRRRGRWIRRARIRDRRWDLHRQHYSRRRPRRSRNAPCANGTIGRCGVRAQRRHPGRRPTQRIPSCRHLSRAGRRVPSWSCASRLTRQRTVLHPTVDSE
jgi:hypothetical protein